MSDPYFGNVVALLHCDGSNGSTTFTDVKGHTFTANGNAQISTVQSKFGSSSYLGDGIGDSITSVDSTDWAFGSTDFTLEGWFRFTAISGITGLFCKRATTAVYGPFNIYIDNADNKIHVLASTSGSTWDLAITCTTVLSVNTWYHIAIVRSGTSFKAYLNGTQDGSSTLSGSVYVNTGALSVGAGAADSSNSLNGYIDDIRITKGVARYTSNFSVPTVAFDNSAETYPLAYQHFSALDTITRM